MDSASATSDVPPALVDLTNHNISPAVDKQLVLELEQRMRFTECLQWFPRSLSRRQTRPLDENEPHATAELGAQDLLRRLERTTML